MHVDDNVCVKGTDYDYWMENERFGIDSQSNPMSYLFTTREGCCIAHGCDSDVTEPVTPPSDVMGYIEEGFEGAEGIFHWIHGGTSTHLADWARTSSKASSFSSGTHSFRSGDLNNIGGKSSDLSVKVSSASGAFMRFEYFVSIGDPFDHFEFLIDGVPKHKDYSPGSEWKRYAVGISPGQHTISWHVISDPDVPSFLRSVHPETFGNGHVYLDNVEFIALNGQEQR